MSLGLTAARRWSPSRHARRAHSASSTTGLSELTSWDTALLPDALAGLEDLDVFSFDDVLPLAATTGKTGPDDIPETPKKPITRKGDIWELGRHRIICGDSCDPKIVERLLDGAKPDLMVTDPPYGVSYDADWRNLADRANGKPYGARAVGKVSNDDRSDWREAYALAPGPVAYVWMGGFTSPIDGLIACGFDFRTMIVWVKNQLVISRGHYHGQHEPCWYAVRKGASAQWTGDRKQTTVWNIDKPRKSETGHSVQKPVECMQRAIHNHQGDVYDPFVGSGSTVIAGEQEGRIVYAIVPPRIFWTAG